MSEISTLLKNITLNTIHKGDCIEVLKKIPSNSIDLIFADPPYFMQTEGELTRVEGTKFNGIEEHWDKFADYKEYDKFCKNWLDECKRILKKDGSIWVIGSFQNIFRLGYIMQDLGFWIINDVIWNKKNPVPNFRGTRFTNAHETLLWCTKHKNSKYTFNYKTMKALNNDKQMRSVWDLALCNGGERLKGDDGSKAHPTQKPESLIYNIIISNSKIGDIVLDPFFGTGTTGAVAKMLHRNYIGIEKEDEYIKVAKTRLKNIIPSLIDDYVKAKFDEKVPNIPIIKLINEGYLNIGDKLYSKNKDIEATITKRGHLFDGNEELSIHKMAAKYLNLSNYNGWGFWFIENGTLIDNLRVAYRNDRIQ